MKDFENIDLNKYEIYNIFIKTNNSSNLISYVGRISFDDVYDILISDLIIERLDIGEVFQIDIKPKLKINDKLISLSVISNFGEIRNLFFAHLFKKISFLDFTIIVNSVFGVEYYFMLNLIAKKNISYSITTTTYNYIW